MFYKLGDVLEEISFDAISDDELVVGLITCEELTEYGPELGFDADTIEASQKINQRFRTGVEVRDNYTFAELRFIDNSGADDFISVFLKKNFLLVVDIFDEDGSTRESLLTAMKKRTGGIVCLEKMIGYFIENLLKDGNIVNERFQNELTGIEESVIKGTAGSDINERLLTIKKRIRKYSNSFSQILDITETLEDNDNRIFDPDKIIYISNLSKKISRSREDIISLNSFSDHLQDAYAAMLDQKLNNTMKVFTLITTIFFPLTIIVGWYGMNFKYMPELNWKYGYVYVIILSIAEILILYLIGKKKKWF